MDERPKKPGIYHELVNLLWLLLLIGIPITSFPPLAEAIGDVTISPFSLLPLMLLIPLWLAPDLLSGGRMPVVAWPLFGFALTALLASGIALFLPLLPFKGESIFDRSIHAGITLVIGLAFYFIASRYPVTDRKIKLTFWGIYLGGLLSLLWGTVQADYVLEGLNNIPQELNEIHRLISIRDLERNRVTGLAFEPSWFGDQIVIMYLPLWASALIERRSLLPWRRGVLSLELGLTLWSVWLLLMTRSRISIGALLFGLGIGLLFVFWHAAGWLRGKLTHAGSRFGAGIVGGLLQGAFLLAAVVVMAAITYGLVLQGAELDWRMRRVLSLRQELPQIREEHPYTFGYEIANRFAFAERVVYWRASLEAFNDYPITGVGLGNAGFLFEEGVPSYGYQLTEIRAFLDPNQPIFPNPKNLWVRLLSETGSLGFAFYLSWLAGLAIIGWRLRRSPSGMTQWIAKAALLSLLMQVIEGFSLDSFSLPQIWIMNGLLTAITLKESDEATVKGAKLVLEKSTIDPTQSVGEVGS